MSGELATPWPVWFDGHLARDADQIAATAGALALATDPELLLGTALFETLACSGGRPERLDPHLVRLERAARSLGRPDPPRVELERAARALAAALPERRAAVRLTLVGTAVIGTSRPIEIPTPGTVGLWLAPPSVRARDPLESIKHASRADKQYRRELARRRGAWDALLSNTEGRPVEATVANLWAAFEGRLVTPPIHHGALPGVVRAELLARTKLEVDGRRWSVEVGPLDRVLLEGAAEVLVTNSLVGALGVDWLEGARGRRALPGAAGPVARAAAEALGCASSFGPPGNPQLRRSSGESSPGPS